MVLIGPETVAPNEQVVVVVSVKERDGAFECRYEVHHPLDGRTYGYKLELPGEVTPLSLVWQQLDAVFAELFPRREYALVYRDQAKTRLLEEVYARVKKAPPKPDSPPAPPDPKL